MDEVVGWRSTRRERKEEGEEEEKEEEEKEEGVVMELVDKYGTAH